MSIDEKQLIQDCLTGRTEAFGELVLRYQDRLYNALCRILGSADDARDVAQDAFVQAFQKLKTFRGQSAFYSWLFRIALNAAATQQRRTRRKIASLDAGRDRQNRGDRPQTAQDPPDHRPDALPSHALESRERKALIQAALDQIAPEFRIPLVLKEIEGLKYQEIAVIIGCPIGTVRSRIHRARTELRQRLESVMCETKSPAP